MGLREPSKWPKKRYVAPAIDFPPAPERSCADGYWGEEGSGSPSLDKPIKSEDGDCGGASSTEDCCGMFGDRKERREACREDFRCTSDPCKVIYEDNSWLGS